MLIGPFLAVAQRFGNRILAVAGTALWACAVALLIVHLDVLLDASWFGILTLAVLIAVALAVGHVLGGPNEDERTALAIACATRHIGIAVLVASSVPGPRTAVIVAVYIITSTVVSIPLSAMEARGYVEGTGKILTSALESRTRAKLEPIHCPRCNNVGIPAGRTDRN